MDDGSEVRAATTGLGGGGTTTTPDPEGPVTAKPTNLEADPEGAATNGVGDRETTDPEAASTASTDPENGVDATDPEATNGVGGGEAPEAEEQQQQQHEILHLCAARYSGRTVVARLIFIARRCGVESTEIEALRMAIEETRKGKDTSVYDDIWDLIKERIPTLYDHDWVESVYTSFNQDLQAIQAEINASQEGRMKGYTNMGNLYYSHGYLADSFKSYMKTEEYITSPEQLVQHCLKAIVINLELCKYDRVLQYVDMAEASQALLDAITAAKLHAAAGLAHLGKMEYRLAALRFLETGPELGNHYSEVTVPEDVAIYGALCALASFDSAEMKVRVMENVNFGFFLQLLPQALQLVHNFYQGRHAACMENLEALKPKLLLDIYLGDHVQTLYFVISQKSGYMVFLEDFELEDLFPTSSPIANEDEEEEEEPTQPQNLIVSNLVLPPEFDGKWSLSSLHHLDKSIYVVLSISLYLPETPLPVSVHYKFLNAKELLLSLGKKGLSWVSKINALALLVNANMFVRDSLKDDEGRFDGRIIMVSGARFSIFETQYSSYTTSQRPLKETRLKDKEDSAVDRFQINMWTRRRICLKNDNRFHLLQWRKTSGLMRAQVQPPEAAAQNDSTQLDVTMKSLIEQLKDHTDAMTQNTEAVTLARQSMVELNCSLAEARKTDSTAATGGVAT